MHTECIQAPEVDFLSIVYFFTLQGHRVSATTKRKPKKKGKLVITHENNGTDLENHPINGIEDISVIICGIDPYLSTPVAFPVWVEMFGALYPIASSTEEGCSRSEFGRFDVDIPKLEQFR